MYNTVKSSKNSKNAFSEILIICLVFSFACHLLFDILGIFSDYSNNFYIYINTYILFAIVVLFIFSRGVNKHFLIFSFFICFFIFLMGQKLFVVIDGGEYDKFLTFKALKLNSKEYFTFINLIYYSVFCCFWGYFLSAPKKTVEYKSDSVIREISLYRTRKVVRIFYCITFVCALIMQIEILRAKSGMSYTDGYLINVDVNPLIKIGNYLFQGMAFLYLACRPSKREMILVLISFVMVDGFLQLFIGRRALLAQTILFFIWFCICYFKAYKKKFTLNHFILLAVFGVVLVMLFGLVEMLRSGNGFNAVPIMDFIEDFFISTGGSDSTIANIIHYSGDFPKQGYIYFFSPIKDAIFDNIVVRQIFSVLFGTDNSSVAQGLVYLGRHDSFAHWLSYIVNPGLYLRGYGMGSSFIAETYFAFGTAGVILFSLMLGWLIRKLSMFNNDSNKIYKKAIALFLVYNMFVLPRGGVFSWATEFLYFIFALLIIKVISGAVSAKSYVVLRGVNNERV